METYEVNRAAVAGHAKAVRLALKQLGMRRCSLQLVYRQCEASAFRLDWYKCFRRWFEALWLANRGGAEFLFENFRAWFEGLRMDAAGCGAGEWYESLARCEREHSEAVQAAILNHDAALIRRELTEAIAAMREQLALLDVRERRAGAA